MKNSHENNELSRRVFSRIEGEQLVPRPRWEFMFKNSVFWALGASAVILGACAVAAAIFDIENAEWPLAVATHASFASFFIDAAPFLWAFALGLFVVIGYLNVRRTNRGYRYPLVVIALGSILTSLTLGAGLYAFGMGQALEEAAGTYVPFYRPILESRRIWWQDPQDGLLGGEVVAISATTSTFILRDFEDTLWEVDSTDLQDPDQVVVARGGIVRLVGSPVMATTSLFHACFAFPWEVHGTFRSKPLPPPLATVQPRASSTVFTQSTHCQSIRPYPQLKDLDDIR